MNFELKALLAALEALAKRRLEQFRHAGTDTPSAEELERWYELQSD
jgi:hypothetical protein